MSGTPNTHPSRIWPATGGTSLPAPTSATVEETIGTSQWALELRPYVHHESLIGALDELASHSEGANPFFEPEFLSASVDRIGEPGKQVIVLWERIGESSIPRLAFPVIEDRIGLPRTPVLRAWSHPFAPLSTPLIDVRDAEEACVRFAQLYPRLPVAGQLPLVFDDLPGDDPVVAMFRGALDDSGFAITETAARTRGYLPPTPGRKIETVLPILTHAKRRKELARQMRKLQALGEVEYQKTEHFEEIVVRFEEFLLLETRGWKGRKGTSIHVLRKTASFARQAVAALGDRGRAAIYSLRLDGRAIASLIMLRAGNRYFPWKIAFDSSYQSYSPGVHLIIHASAELMATEGFAGADSLAAERSWIDRIWPARLSLETLIFAPPGTQATARVDVAAKSVTRELKLRRLARNLLKRNPPLPASTAVAAVAAAGAPRQSPVRETVGE